VYAVKTNLKKKNCWISDGIF